MKIYNKLLIVAGVAVLAGLFAMDTQFFYTSVYGDTVAVKPVQDEVKDKKDKPVIDGIQDEISVESDEENDEEQDENVADDADENMESEDDDVLSEDGEENVLEEGDEALGDAVCDEAKVRQRINDAEKKVERARLTLDKKEGQGKDVSRARETLENAEQELERARQQLEEGDCTGAQETAKESKHSADIAKSKDVLSTSPKALLARAFGKCISEAARAKDFAAFANCHQEFKNNAQEEAADDLSEEDRAANEELRAQLDTILAGVEDEFLIAVLEEFKTFNFSGIDVDAVVAEIESILAGEASPEEKETLLRELLTGLQESSSEEKYDDGVIPFTDADDSEWFFAYADVLKEEACIQGYVNADGTLTGEFGPGEPVLFGESLKFVLSCLMGDTPLAVAEGDHWASGYAAVLQNEYADYVSPEFMARVELAMQNQDMFNEGVSRAEIIQFIIDVLGIDVPEVTEAPFTDVPANHPNAAAIAYALQAGVISGDAETGTFRPGDVPNRAEMVKIIILSKELL